MIFHMKIALTFYMKYALGNLWHENCTKQNMKFELEYLTHEICTKKVNGKITEKLNNTMELSTNEICTK